jgi:hypothetical protein
MCIEVVEPRPGRHGHIDLQQRLAGWPWFVDISYAHLPNPGLRPFILGLEDSVGRQRIARPGLCVSGLPARYLAGDQPRERAVGRCAEVVTNPHSDPSLGTACVKVGRTLREQIDTTNRCVTWNLTGDDRRHRKERLVFGVQRVNQIPKCLVHCSVSNSEVNRTRPSKCETFAVSVGIGD